MVLCICPNPSIDCYAEMENLEFGVANRIESLKEYPGGKGTHVAMALAEMGIDVTLFGFWAGASGHWISDECKKRNVAIQGPEIVGNNRKCYTFKSKNKELNATELMEPGPYIKGTEWMLYMEQLERSIELSDIVSLSGSWPKGASENAAYQVAEICRKKGKRLILDCSGIQLRNALESKFYALHLNEHESEEIFGSSSMDVAFEQLKDTVELVALTKGKEGLYLASKAGKIHALKPLDRVISTVGSGDCLTAGLIFAVLKNKGPEEIARYGAAFGAANCITEDLGMLRKEHVADFLPQTILSNPSDK